MSEEERKARNMRESVGIKDWIAQSKDGSTHSHQGKELLALPSVWQQQNSKHSKELFAFQRSGKNKTANMAKRQ